MTQARSDFEDALAEALRGRLGDECEKYSIPSLVGTVANVSDLEDTDRANWTVATDLLVKILKGERGRLRRIEDWNRKQTQK